MTKKVGKDELKKLVESVLSEGQRLDEFKISIPKNKQSRDKVNTALGLDDNTFKDAAGATTFGGAYPKYKDLAKAGTDKNNINDDDFQAAWDMADGTPLNDFADAIADKSTKSDSSWAAIGGTNNPKAATPGRIVTGKVIIINVIFICSSFC